MARGSPTPGRERLADVGAWIGVVAAYVVGTVVFLWPMPARMGTHIWGDRFDAWTTLWLIDHLGEGLADGTLTAQTTEIIFPIGYNLWSFGHAALQLIGAVMVAVGFPLVWSYNALLVLGIATTGLAGHLLGRTLGGGHVSGFIAGVVLCTSPYLYGEGAAGCIELTAAGLIPLFGWTLVRLAREPTWTRALQSALALAIIGPFNWYYTLFAGMLGLGLVAWHVVEGHRRAAAMGLGAMVLAGALNAPLVPLVRRETPTRPQIDPIAFTDEATWNRAKEVADVRVTLDELTEDRLLELDALQVVQNSTRVPALLVADFPVNPLDSTPGRLAFGLGLIGFLAAPRQTRGWMVIATGATVLTLGPFLTIDGTPPLPGWSAENPLPYYYAYEHVPFFSKAYRPYRIGVIALTCLAAMAGAGLGSLRGRLPEWARVAFVALVAVAGFSQPHWASAKPAERPLADARIPTIYERLAELPDGAVIEVPLAYQPYSVANARFQYNQVVHDKPLLNCNQLIRRTDLANFRDYVDDNPFLQTALDLGRRPLPYSFGGAELAALHADGFRYVVAHTKVEADAVQLAGDMGTADLLGLAGFEILRLSLGEPVLGDDFAVGFGVPADRSGRTWTLGEDAIQSIELDMDAMNLGLPIVLQPEDTLPLWEGQAGTLAFWARVDTEGLAVRVEGTEVRRQALVMDAAHWQWVEVALPDEAVSVSLEGVGAQAAQLAVTRVEVAR